MTRADRTFPIVGVGASAGGLEALTQLLESLPENTGIAFVLVKDLEIHLLVTDMVMPGIGGREVARRFLASRPQSRVLFMSGYTEDSVFGPDGPCPRSAGGVELISDRMGPLKAYP